MNHKWIIVYDLETDSAKPEEANITEIAAVAIHPRTLDIKTDDAFKLTVKPPGITKDEYFTSARQDTIQWHANTRGCTSEDIIKLWKSGKSTKIALKSFCTFLEKYHIEKDPARKIYYTEPVYSGYNVNGFDDIIIRRLLNEHKLKYPFAKMGHMDVMDIIGMWFENLPEPKSYKLDEVKAFLGLESHGQAHEALSDVIDTAKILTRFLKFSRRQASVDKFKGAFA